MIRRRDFIAGLGSAAVWPLVADAQPGDRVRRVGVLMGSATEADVLQRANLVLLRDGLAKLGWMEGRDLRMDVRFAASDLNRIRAYAAELVSLVPDVLVVTPPTMATIAVQERTQTIPIVFTAGGDPLVSGVVRNIVRPEGNTTGFSNYEPSFAGKWLTMLKAAAPRLTRVAVIFSPELVSSPFGSIYMPSIEAAAPTFALQMIKLPIRDVVDVVRGIDAFAAEPNGGLVVLPPAPYRETVIRLAAQHRLPAIFHSRDIAVTGGLMSYGSASLADQFHRAASYVDRLLRGAKVSDLPVQFPTKFELVINLKTAKTLGLTIPETLLATADEVIQ
jgi:putative ABC transport system substrate-binding protein